MTSSLPEVSRRLIEALLAAYPDHVLRRLQGDDIGGLDEALAKGRDWLELTLTELLSKPFAQQRRGPLEVFQEAMRFPTEHLAGTGRAPSPRDPVASVALPGDLYDLAPPSTRALGEEVWMLHIQWGAAKAAALRSPSEPGLPGDDS